MQSQSSDFLSAEKLQLFVAGLSGLAPEEVRKAKLLYIRNAISEYQAMQAALQGFGQTQGCMSIIPVSGRSSGPEEDDGGGGITAARCRHALSGSLLDEGLRAPEGARGRKQGRNPLGDDPIKSPTCPGPWPSAADAARFLGNRHPLIPSARRVRQDRGRSDPGGRRPRPLRSGVRAGGRSRLLQRIGSVLVVGL